MIRILRASVILIAMLLWGGDKYAHLLDDQPQPKKTKRSSTKIAAASVQQKEVKKDTVAAAKVIPPYPTNMNYYGNGVYGGPRSTSEIKHEQ